MAPDCLTAVPGSIPGGVNEISSKCHHPLFISVDILVMAEISELAYAITQLRMYAELCLHLELDKKYRHRFVDLEVSTKLCVHSYAIR